METFEAFRERLALPESAEARLREAFTHRTYAVEHNLDYDNQRLEFLGDAVLEIIQTEYLFELYPDSPEGELTKIRSALACESALAELSRHLRFGEHLRIGRGEAECGGAERASTLADLFEAVLGAIYLGAGYETARSFVRKLMQQFYPDPHQVLVSLNPKGLLQELSQGRWGCTPAYSVLRFGGPLHDPFYDVEVRLREYVAIGRGRSRKLAESAAACSLYRYLVSYLPEGNHAVSK